MNILVIGNGFDLAHDLPTKYTDFLCFIKVIMEIFDKFSSENSEIDWGEINSQIRKQIWKDMGNVRDNLYSKEAMWKDLIWNNFWIDYFQQNSMYQKENWIDFESEISKVIQSLDEDMGSSISGCLKLEDKIQRISNGFLNKRYLGWFGKNTYKELRDILLDDLNKLIRAFEIYLCEYVEKIDIQNKLSDIESLKIDYVLSFNYTNTFSRLYDSEGKIEFDFIHGKADINNTIESNNMVLGIDEYLENDRKNRDVEFVAFKKFYQRIYKETGCKYKSWIKSIRKEYISLNKNEETFTNLLKQAYNADDNSKFLWNYFALVSNNEKKKERHNLYIFGHSLDITDKDILCDLILNDNVYTTIFYHNKDVMGQQIVNLVKVIGQDELIKRTGGSAKTIEFKPQQDIVDIK